MPARLIVIGNGATAERLAEIGGRLGYHEIRVTDRFPADVTAEDHVIVAEDEAGPGRSQLVAAARAETVPAYLGYAAPHREGWKALVRLAAENVPKERIDAISAPAGVDVGAESPEEVAIAVAAELVAMRRGRRRPSAGLAIGLPRSSGPEPRPRRLIGAFGRQTGEDPEGEKGRN